MNPRVNAFALNNREESAPIVSSPGEELYSFEHDAIIVIPFIIQLLRTISVAIVPSNRIWDFLHVQSVEKDGSVCFIGEMEATGDFKVIENKG